LALVTGVAQRIDLLQELTASDTITAVRLIGSLFFMPENLISQEDTAMSVAMAIGVAARDSFAAGVVPSAGIPGETPARGWMWRSRMMLYKEHATGSAGEIMIPGEKNFDVRANRKVDRGVLYLEVITINILHTAVNTRLEGLVRALCLT